MVLTNFAHEGIEHASATSHSPNWWLLTAVTAVILLALFMTAKFLSLAETEAVEAAANKKPDRKARAK